MQKLTTRIARELAMLGVGAILEDLKNIKKRILRNRRDLNNKLSKWNAGPFEFMPSYKPIWMDLPLTLSLLKQGDSGLSTTALLRLQARAVVSCPVKGSVNGAPSLSI